MQHLGTFDVNGNTSINYKLVRNIIEYIGKKDILSLQKTIIFPLRLPLL